MQRKAGHALHDMLQAIERTEAITAGKTLGDFSADWQLQWLAQRAIEIISEASRAIPDEMKARQPENSLGPGPGDRQRHAPRV